MLESWVCRCRVRDVSGVLWARVHGEGDTFCERCSERKVMPGSVGRMPLSAEESRLDRRLRELREAGREVVRADNPVRSGGQYVPPP